MLDDKKRLEFDQQIAVFVEFMPITWRQLYVRLNEEGFTERQSLELVKAYIMAECGLSK